LRWAARYLDMVSVRAHLSPRQRTTLELGSSVLLTGLGLGLGVGRWPAWSMPLVAAGYCAWVIVYAELTVQAERRQRRLSAQAPPAPKGEQQAA
jgi:hypothetical protein